MVISTINPIVQLLLINYKNWNTKIIQNLWFSGQITMFFHGQAPILS